MMPVIAYVIIGLLITSIGGGVVFTYQHAITRAERAEADLKTEQANGRQTAQALADQRVENAKAEARAKLWEDVAKARRDSDNRIAELEKRLDGKFRDLIASNADVRAWSNTRVPAAVLAIVRNAGGGEGAAANGAGTGAAPAAGGQGVANPGASVARPDVQRGIVRLREAGDKPAQ